MGEREKPLNCIPRLEDELGLASDPPANELLVVAVPPVAAMVCRVLATVTEVVAVVAAAVVVILVMIQINGPLPLAAIARDAKLLQAQYDAFSLRRLSLFLLDKNNSLS